MTRPDDAAIGRAALAKASWRLLPMLGLGYGVASMNRVNISFASLKMNADLHFSGTVYGRGGGDLADSQRPPVGTIGSFLAPYGWGVFKDATSGYPAGLAVPPALVFAAAAIVLWLRASARREATRPPRPLPLPVDF